MSTPDQIAVAQLTGAAKRHGGWTPPQGAARQEAIDELRAITTRPDLLAEAAGLLLGFDPPDTTHFDLARNAAALLVEAGADPDQIDDWITEGENRRGQPLPGV